MQDKYNQLQVALLQLQRSALIDTQTIMQIMVDKGICDLETIIETRSKIESESEDVKRINDQILSQGGTIVITPDSDIPIGKKAELKKQLAELKQLLSSISEED